MQQIFTERRNGTPPIFENGRLKTISLKPIPGSESSPPSYLEKLTRLRDTPLHNLHEQLIASFRESGVSIDFQKIEVTTTSPGSSEELVANQMVDLSYNLRYVDDHGQIIPIAAECEPNEETKTQTLIAVQKEVDQSFVLATFKVDFSTSLDAFKLFESEFGWPWPHEQPALQTPGELKRLAYSPFIDQMAVHPDEETRMLARWYRQQLLLMMWPKGMEILKEHNVDIVYFILAEHTRRYVVSSGIEPVIPVNSLRPSETDYARNVRNTFPGYWQEEPKVYIAPVKAKEPVLYDRRRQSPCPSPEIDFLATQASETYNNTHTLKLPSFD